MHEFIKLIYQIYKILNRMSSGFYLTSGFLYNNMGAEMLFVLLNRMTAQKIDMDTSKEKFIVVGSKILSDIILTLYKPAFV